MKNFGNDTKNVENFQNTSTEVEQTSDTYQISDFDDEGFDSPNISKHLNENIISEKTKLTNSHQKRLESSADICNLPWVPHIVVSNMTKWSVSWSASEDVLHGRLSPLSRGGFNITGLYDLIPHAYILEIELALYVCPCKI